MPAPAAAQPRHSPAYDVFTDIRAATDALSAKVVLGWSGLGTPEPSLLTSENPLR